MIISRTPFRISLFGGGTDYPAWYRRHGGAVIGASINKYCYVSIRSLPPFFAHRNRIVYSQIELPQRFDEIQHPAVRAILLDQNVENGVEVQHHGDLPARAGMGSSSTFTVGLLHSVRAHKGLSSTAEILAQESIRIEQDVIREDVGSQDQIWAAYGGVNLIRFETDGAFQVTPLPISEDRQADLESHMLLFFTGLSRLAPTIAKKQIANMDNRISQLRTMRQMVDEAATVLENPKRPIREIGSMLGDAWKLKKELADTVSNPAVDGIYAAAIECGAAGGKLLGAGGGGFMLIMAEPRTHDAIRDRLKSLTEVSFKIGSPGSTIVIYEPDGLETRSEATPVTMGRGA
ncbi:MAG TPA: kinase [Terriglobia bacterium]|nr:kinase [Terriglobia bacterium]